MKPVIAPLRPRETGPSVTDLHEALPALVELGAVMRDVDPAPREQTGSSLLADASLKSIASAVRSSGGFKKIEANLNWTECDDLWIAVRWSG